MAVRLFQTIIHQIQAALGGRAAGVIDETGKVIACTDHHDEVWQDASDISRDTSENYVFEGKTFRRLSGRKRSGYTVLRWRR